MANKKRSASSSRWLQEHFSDKYVLLAQKKGLRSRAWFKLDEIQQGDKLFKPGMTVVDLGAAPGSWSQVVSHQVGNNGKVIALDILDMQPLSGVTFIQNDFREECAVHELKKHLDDQHPDLVISDMSPNISGIVVSDQARSMHLAELALAFSLEQLNYGGNFLVKVFQGRDFDQFLRNMRSGFKNVAIRKPKASRDRSNELYLLGLGKKK